MITKIIGFLTGSFSETVFNYITEAYERAVGTGLYFGMFVIAILYIIFVLKNDEHDRAKIIFGLYSIIILVLNLNPIFANFSIKILGSSVYWRVYWMLPIGLALAFVFTELIYRMPNRVKKIGGFVLIVAAIAIGGNFVYSEENFSSVSNYYKVPDTVLEIIWEVSADDEDEKKLAGPLEFEVYTRQIDGTINLVEYRSFTGTYRDNSIVTYITNGDYVNIYKKAIEKNCNYIVLPNSVKTGNDNLTNYGFIELCENQDYTLYKLEEDVESWKITQYGDNEGDQLMCYTVESDDGLIIIDGGYEDSEELIETLKEKIAEYDNHIDAWIITHFDSDHCGAFKTIYTELKDEITIDHIYTQGTPNISVAKESASWYTDEEWELYEWFVNLSEKEIVEIGFETEIIGLKFEVLSVYDDWMDDELSNLLNQGSMVFKLYGNEQSMIFMADAQSTEIEEFLIENYEDRLSSDYIQVGHHGNNSFSDEFYDIVNPDIALFSAPEWVIENTNNVSWYQAPHLWEYLQSIGAKTYYFASSPVTITLK